MQKASNQLVEADEHARRQELLTTALQAEINSLEAQIAHTQKQRHEAQSAALAAMEIALGEEWNHLAEQLAVVGARIWLQIVIEVELAWRYQDYQFQVLALRPESSSEMMC